MKKYILILFIVFSLFFIPKANAQVTRVQIYKYNNGFTNTYDSSYTSNTFSNLGVNGTNFRITFNDTLQANHNYTLSLTLTLTSDPVSWFRWSSNPMSGVLVGSAYVVSSPSSGTTLVNRYDHQYCVGGQACWDFYRKQSNIVFTFKPTSVSSPWSVNIPFDDSQFSYYSIDSYTLTDSGTSTNDTQAIINNNNINTQNIIDSQNNTTNSVNDINDTLQDTNVGNIDLSGVNEISDTPITDLLTLPLTLLQQVYNSINSSCSPYSLEFGLWGGSYTLSFPCLNLGHERYFGRIVWGVIDDLLCILLLYNLFKMIIWFYSSWTTLTDNFEYLFDPSNKGGIF